MAEGTLNEYRNALYDFVKSKFPTWPEYVLKDFLYAQAKGIRDQEELKDFLDRNQKDFGQVKWRLEKLPITLDIFTPKTQQMIKQREGGSSNPFQVPRDAERHAQQLKMIQQQGVRTEPIIVAKLNNGYDLIEGWHRTIQHLQQYPDGYIGPAWVAYGATYTSDLKQGVAEGGAENTEGFDRLVSLGIKLVDIPAFTKSGTSKLVITGDDRPTVVVNINGVNMPFYQSTGGGGKLTVPVGKWYPFFGTGPGGWINKGSEKSINAFYGSSVLKTYANLLNLRIGNVLDNRTLAPMKKAGRDIINQDMLGPQDNFKTTEEANKFKNRINTILQKIGSDPFYTVVEQGVAEDR